MNSWYVWSGELCVKVLANTPIEAAVKALSTFGGGKTLDARYFICDQCGFRTGPNACSKDGYVLDVSEVIRAAGYVFEEDDEEGCE